MQQKTGLILAVVCLAAIAAGAFIYSQVSYKYCFRCDANDFYTRGLKYACSDKATHRKVALEFLENSARQGKIEAELTLAELYSGEFPEGYVMGSSEPKQCLQQEIPPDEATGIAWFDSVVQSMEKQGIDLSEVVLNNLALLYLNNILPADNQRQKAISLFEKAAAIGSYPAMRTLARLYHEEGLYGQAVEWFRKAAENPNDVASPLRIGDYYRYGKGVDADLVQAEEWYARASARIEKSPDKVPAEIADKVSARLAMVRLKLAEIGERKQVVLHYRLEGGVRHFIVFVDTVPDKPVGEVINDNGTIRASLNPELELPAEGEASSEDLATMIDGMNWVLENYARRSRTDDKPRLFEFLLSKG